MKFNTTLRFSPSHQQGMTLIEISIVIALILALISISWVSYVPIRNWQKAKDAGISLQAVYTAQKTFLADHPTSSTVPNISVDGKTITEDQLKPYLPGSTTGALASMPTAVDLDNNVLTIDFTVIPPVLKNGATVFPDTSGSTADGLWDIGKP